MSELLQAAQRYANRGWPVFPVRPRGKAPLTRHGLKDATTDPGLARGWWEQWPDANIGVRTGAESKLLVLDIDGDEGFDSLHELERRHGKLPATASVKTPRQGCHLYFAHPGAGVIPNNAGALGPKLDIRCDGGYVLAPPSIGANGRKYEPDVSMRVQPAPSWLLEALRPQRKRKAMTPGSEWARLVREGAVEGQRNHQLARLTGYLLNRHVDPFCTLEIARLVNERFRPPLGAEEVDRVVGSIVGRELAKP